jgi:hypothetical protein
MTKIKTFLIGALFGTILGATVFGATFHFLLIGIAVLGVGAVVLRGRRRLLSQRDTHKSLKA